MLIVDCESWKGTAVTVCPGQCTAPLNGRGAPSEALRAARIDSLCYPDGSRSHQYIRVISATKKMIGAVFKYKRAILRFDWGLSGRIIKSKYVLSLVES